MPAPWLVDYWQGMAEVTLPFLRGRKVAVQQVFDGNVVYRRHGGKGLPTSRGWIRINSIDELMAWVHLHTYSFHPHLLGEKDSWFVIDVDGRDGHSLEITKIVSLEMSNLLTKKGLKHLIKFSGGNGFHFMWSIGHNRPNWLSFRKTIRKLAAELEPILEKKYQNQFRSHIPKSSPLIITSSSDRAHAKSILLDEQIIHKSAVVRSPYSIHPKTGLASVPLTLDQLDGFTTDLAQLKNVKPNPVTLPLNG